MQDVCTRALVVNLVQGRFHTAERNLSNDNITTLYDRRLNAKTRGQIEHFGRPLY